MRVRVLPLGVRTLVNRGDGAHPPPTSFSDGGMFDDAESAVAHATQLTDEGADVDIGGESTRPGAEPVPLEETHTSTMFCCFFSSLSYVYTTPRPG